MDQDKQQKGEQLQTESKEDLMRPTTKKTNKRSRYKIIIFNVVNVLLIAIVLFLLSRLPETAERIKELRSENILAQESSDIAVLKSTLERNEQDIDELENVLVDEEGFVKFISRIDALKANEAVSEFTFPGGRPVVDKEDDLGFQFTVTLRGSREAVDSALRQIMSLPYVIKPVNFDLSLSAENEILLTYTGFLIVNEDFNQN